MRFKRPTLKFALDESVPDSVGGVLKKAGHKVLFLNKIIPRGSDDRYVCVFAQLNNAILVAIDADMRQIARKAGVGSSRFKKLSLLKLSCRETQAAFRVEEALTLIEHEWFFSSLQEDRRVFLEIGDSLIKTNR